MARRKYILLIFLLLPIITAGQVPNSDSFGLDTVVTVISATSPTLQTCFDEAHPEGFDPLYEGDKDRLSNFRNYWHYEDATEYKTVYYNYDNASIANQGGDWTNVQTESNGDAVLTDSYYHVRVEDQDPLDGYQSWLIRRSYLTFDLSGIPSTAEIDSAQFVLKIENENDDGTTHEINIYGASHGNTLETTDFDNYDSSDPLATQIGFYSDGLYFKVTQESNLFNIENDFGGLLQIAIIHEQDRSSITPPDDVVNYFEFFRSGECQISGEYGCEPQMKIWYHYRP